MDVKKIWVVARHEYVASVRRAGFIIMTLSVPVLGLIFLGAGVFFAGQASALGDFMERQFDPGSQLVGVVDRSGYFPAILPEYADNFRLYPDQGQAETALLAEDVTAVLVIDTDYLETGKVVVLNVGSGFGAAAVGDSMSVRAFLVAHVLEGQVDPAVQARAADPMTIESRVLSSTGQTQGEGQFSFVFTFIIPYFLAIFLVVTVFTSSGYLLQGVAEEKENRVVEIVVSSVRPMELMAGKVIGLGAVGLTQVLVWVLSSWALSGSAVALLTAAGAVAIPPRVFILGVVYYVLGYTLYAILMAGVGALGTTSRESQQLAGIFSLFASLPYMISGFLFTNPNALLARILSFFPLTAPTMMMLRLPLAEVPWIDVAGSIVGLLIAIPLALWLGGKLFRMGLLVYGKRPTLREIWTILRTG
ncbi:MAG: ABC transporter permease [Anaerolineae bacterium]|nr:ABC transporter permease [Anaerolineae bacterium]